MPHYQHLTVAERYQIFILLKAGFSYSAVALQLHRHRSTIHCSGSIKLDTPIG